MNIKELIKSGAILIGIFGIIFLYVGWILLSIHISATIFSGICNMKAMILLLILGMSPVTLFVWHYIYKYMDEPNEKEIKK